MNKNILLSGQSSEDRKTKLDTKQTTQPTEGHNKPSYFLKENIEEETDEL